MAPAWVAEPRSVSAQVVRRGDRGDDADRLAALLEHGALLDVQLDERVDRRRGRCAPRPAGRARSPRRAAPRPCSCRRGRTAGRGRRASSCPAAARLPTQPVPKRGSSPAHATSSIERRGASPRARSRWTASIAPSTPSDAVVAAGVERRVDVRAGEHQRRGRRAPGPAAEQVADGVEPDLEPGVAHPRRDAVERRAVRGRVDLARDPARVRVVVVAGQLGDRVVQPGRSASPRGSLLLRYDRGDDQLERADPPPTSPPSSGTPRRPTTACAAGPPSRSACSTATRRAC